MIYYLVYKIHYNRSKDSYDKIIGFETKIQDESLNRNTKAISVKPIEKVGLSLHSCFYVLMHPTQNRFLTFDDVTYIHSQEIKQAESKADIRSKDDIFACLEAPKATFDGNYLMNVFEMAASYLVSFTIRHPFTDGNKRVALACAIIFLEINGYEVEEENETDFADIVFDFLDHKITKDKISAFFESKSSNTNE